MSQQKTPIDFDIDRYMRASKRLDLSEVDWDDIPNHELSDGDIMCAATARGAGRAEAPRRLDADAHAAESAAS